jgi:hypothetical protein
VRNRSCQRRGHIRLRGGKPTQPTWPHRSKTSTSVALPRGRASQHVFVDGAGTDLVRIGRRWSQVARCRSSAAHGSKPVGCTTAQNHSSRLITAHSRHHRRWPRRVPGSRCYRSQGALHSQYSQGAGADHGGGPDLRRQGRRQRYGPGAGGRGRQGQWASEPGQHGLEQQGLGTQGPEARQETQAAALGQPRPGQSCRDQQHGAVPEAQVSQALAHVQVGWLPGRERRGGPAASTTG